MVTAETEMKQDPLETKPFETFTVDPYKPESPFSGIDPYQLIVQPTEFSTNIWGSIPDETKSWWIGFSTVFNRQLLHASFKGGVKGFFKTIKDADAMENEHRTPINQVISQLVLVNQQIIVAPALFGSHYHAVQLLDLGFDPEKIHFVNIRGTIGTNEGKARIQQKLSEEILDPERIIVFRDDVVDTVMTLATLVIERRKKKMGRVDLDENEHFVLENIEATKKGKKTFIDLSRKTMNPQTASLDEPAPYELLVQWMEEEHVLLAADISKNKAFLSVMGTHIHTANQRKTNGTGASWADIQTELFERMYKTSHDLWLMGGSKGAVLDTKVTGAELLKHLETLPLEDKLKNHIINQAKNKGIEHIDLRLGAPLQQKLDLIAITDPIHGYDILCHEAAKVLALCLLQELPINGFTVEDLRMKLKTA